MLQQTQVSRVIPYYQRFLQRFPTINELAAASWDEFLPFYEGLGYYARGRNMLATARAVVEHHAGEFPQTETELLNLPGIGPYTARAILSFAFHKPILAPDTNLQRVFGRLLSGNKKASLHWDELSKHLSDPAKINAAVMDFSSAVCTKNPLCSACPLFSHCQYFADDGKSEAAPHKTKHPFPQQIAQTLLILHRDHKEYFSSEDSRYAPFFLPAPLNTRAAIKSFFQREHQLLLSIRPPHRKLIWNNTPTQLVNAQILQGTQHFSIFKKTDYEQWQECFDERASQLKDQDF